MAAWRAAVERRVSKNRIYLANWSWTGMVTSSVPAAIENSKGASRDGNNFKLPVSGWAGGIVKVQTVLSADHVRV